VPAIWGIAPVDRGLYCLGSQFDAHANNIADGWACVAAAAADRNGNASVSAPLRVYIQRRGLVQPSAGVCPAPPGNAGPPPDCTGTFERATGNVTTRPCRASRRFISEARPIGPE
jgi:hypothetical protein